MPINPNATFKGKLLREMAREELLDVIAEIVQDRNSLMKGARMRRSIFGPEPDEANTQEPAKLPSVDEVRDIVANYAIVKPGPRLEFGMSAAEVAQEKAKIPAPWLADHERARLEKAAEFVMSMGDTPQQPQIPAPGNEDAKEEPEEPRKSIYGGRQTLAACDPVPHGENPCVQVLNYGGGGGGDFVRYSGYDALNVNRLPNGGEYIEYTPEKPNTPVEEVQDYYAQLHAQLSGEPYTIECQQKLADEAKDPRVKAYHQDNVNKLLLAEKEAEWEQRAATLRAIAENKYGVNTDLLERMRRKFNEHERNVLLMATPKAGSGAENPLAELYRRAGYLDVETEGGLRGVVTEKYGPITRVVVDPGATEPEQSPAEQCDEKVFQYFVRAKRLQERLHKEARLINDTPALVELVRIIQIEDSEF